MGRRLRGQTGAATVEFALVLVVLIPLLMGIVEFGRAYNAKLAMQHAVREGVRVWATAQGEADVLQQTRDAVINAATPTITIAEGDVNPGPEGCVPGQPTSVTATYAFKINAMVAAEIDMSARGVMRCGG